MKRFMNGLMGLAIVAAPAFAGPANLLINGDLEAPAGGADAADGWTLIEPDVDTSGAPVNSAEFIGFANHTPAGARGLWYRSFMGGLGSTNPPQVDAELRQDVAATAGENYNLSAWFRYETNYPGLSEFSNTDTLLAMDFLQGGSVIGSVVLNVDTAYDLGQVNQWQQFTISGTAPAGTDGLRVRSNLVDGELQTLNPQSAFVDDFVLTPEPTSLGLLALAGLALIRRR